jgi:hypothetical protein
MEGRAHALTGSDHGIGCGGRIARSARTPPDCGIPAGAHAREKTRLRHVAAKSLARLELRVVDQRAALGIPSAVQPGKRALGGVHRHLLPASVVRELGRDDLTVLGLERRIGPGFTAAQMGAPGLRDREAVRGPRAARCGEIGLDQHHRGLGRIRAAPERHAPLATSDDDLVAAGRIGDRGSALLGERREQA